MAGPFMSGWDKRRWCPLSATTALAHPTTQDTPPVQIGQVDVIIEASHAPETKSAPAPENDFASRHFLRRL